MDSFDRVAWTIGAVYLLVFVGLVTMTVRSCTRSNQEAAACNTKTCPPPMTPWYAYRDEQCMCIVVPR